jgi:hypothetical protein
MNENELEFMKNIKISWSTGGLFVRYRQCAMISAGLAYCLTRLVLSHSSATVSAAAR